MGYILTGILRPTMNWRLEDIEENREGVVGINGLGCDDGGGGERVESLGFNRLKSSCTRSTVRLIDSRPMLISRLRGSTPR